MATLVLATDAPVVNGPPQGHWTLAAWERLPGDGNRYEVIDGVLYMITAPSYFHQYMVLQLIRHIGIPAEDQGLARVGFAPIGVIMPGCDPVQPDFVVVLSPHAGIIHNRRIFGVPDLSVEILSPSNHAYDEQVKLQAYANAGLPEYAIIDPAARTLRRYQLAAPGRYAAPEISDQGATVHFACLPHLGIVVGDLFAGAQDTTI